MIVKHKNTGKEYLVEEFWIDKSSEEDCFFCIDIETSKSEDFRMRDVLIVDGHLPPNFAMMRYTKNDGNIVFKFGMDSALICPSEFWEDYEDGQRYAVKKYYDFLDGLTDLHGLPRMKHPEIPAPPEEHEPTEEERRLKRIEDELNSYLDE